MTWRLLKGNSTTSPLTAVDAKNLKVNACKECMRDKRTKGLHQVINQAGRPQDDEYADSRTEQGNRTSNLARAQRHLRHLPTEA